MAAEFKVGEVVQLKSGGPKMTVQGKASDGDIVTKWFAGSKSESGFFRPETLVKVTEEK